MRQQGALYRPPLTKVHAESVGHQCGRYDLLRFSPTYDADGVAFHICGRRVFRSGDSGASWAAVSVPQLKHQPSSTSHLRPKVFLPPPLAPALPRSLAYQPTPNPSA